MSTTINGTNNSITFLDETIQNTAAIQELNAKVDAQALEIQALKGTV